MAMHSKILNLQKQTAGEFLSSRYDTQVDLKIRADVASRVVKGYLAVFGVKDSYGTVAVKGCFARSIAERGPDSGAKNKIIFLAWHDPYNPLGPFTVLREDDYGLYFEAKVSDARDLDRILTQIQDGTINQYSYGFRYIWDKMEYDEATDTIMMYEVQLIEGSCLAINAANPETYTVRNDEDFASATQALNSEMEEAICTLPPRRQMEIRQLVTRYKALLNYKTPRQQLEEKNEQIESPTVFGFKI